jgi:hypothetical protein
MSREFLQQHLGLSEIGRVKPLGEPAVHRRQQLWGFSELPLALPQPTQTYGGPQFQRLRLLGASNVKTNCPLLVCYRGYRPMLGCRNRGIECRRSRA